MRKGTKCPSGTGACLYHVIAFCWFINLPKEYIHECKFEHLVYQMEDDYSTIRISKQTFLKCYFPL